MLIYRPVEYQDFLYNMTGKRIRARQIFFYATDFWGVHFYLRARLCTRLIEKQLDTIRFVVCYLNRTCSFHFYCNSIESFCIEAFVDWMLFECLKQNASQRINLIIQTHPFEGIQKNRNSATYPLVIISRKIAEQIFWERQSTDTFDSCFNGPLMLRHLIDLNFKMITSVLAAREISPIEF